MNEESTEEMITKLSDPVKKIMYIIHENSKAITALLAQQEQVIELICKLHNIDIEKLRKTAAES